MAGDFFKAATRPMLAYISIVALVWFYTLEAFGNDIPVEIHGFWGPVLWWFGERTIQHIRKGDK